MGHYHTCVNAVHGHAVLLTRPPTQAIRQKPHVPERIRCLELPWLSNSDGWWNDTVQKQQKQLLHIRRDQDCTGPTQQARLMFLYQSAQIRRYMSVN
jgi:hypothetical protein